jgi:hypothetical protein
MKPFSKLALSFALVALSPTCSWAQSGSPSSEDTFRFGASFALVGTPDLRTGMAMFDSGRTTVGSWTSGNKTDTLVMGRELTDSGWSSWQGDANRNKSGGPPLWMGENVANLNRGPTTGSAGVFYTNLGASLAATPSARVEASTNASWSRDFQLDAHSSLTFSGMATLSIGGGNLFDAYPKPPSPSSHPAPVSIGFDADHGYGYSRRWWSDNAEHTIGTAVTGSLRDSSLNPADVFSYSASSYTGAMTLTVTNTSDVPIFGTLGANSWANITSAVPEPETYATLLVGLGVVGAVARRRRALATASV